MPLEPGKSLGPYEILSLTGVGGMGEVYKARDSRLDRTVAIKVLPESMSMHQDIRARFEREAKSISSLNHPNICTLHDIGNENGTGYLVMEYLEGKTLDEKLQEGPLANDELLEYSLQIVDALDKAHKQGLIHRDLKPANVMLTKEGAKLLDFGLAKLQMSGGDLGTPTAITQTSTPLTEQGTILGTVQYMSPEQLEGIEADARADIFAFGAMLYEMVTGTRAFQGNSKATLIASIIKEQPRPVSEVQPLAPPMFERIIRQCLAKDKEDRWQTAADLKHAIEWIAEGGSEVGIPKTLTRRRRLRERAGISFTVLLLLATVFLSVQYYAKLNEPGEEKIISRFTVHLEQGLTNISWPRISPDGKLIAFRATDSLGTRQIWVRPVNSLDAYPLFRTQGVNRHYWSPDSKFLTFFDGNQLMKIPVAGGQSQLLSEGVNGADCSWGSKDIILFDGAERDPLRMVSANGGQVTTTAEVDTLAGEILVGWPWFLPDGEHFIFIANNIDSTSKTNSQIKLGSINSPDSKVLHDLKRDVRVEYSKAGFILFVQDNNLMALPFDDKALEVTGEAKPIARDVSLSGNAEAFGMSDNGTLLYHSSSTNATSQFMWVDRDGREISKVGASGNYLDANLSPDETKLAYAMQEDGNDNNIWIYDLRRNVPTKLTFDAQNEVWPIWSPDGQHILYASNKTGRYAIYQKDISGLEEATLVHANDSGNVGPSSFTSDGKTFLFNISRADRDIGMLHLDDSNRVDLFANSSFTEQMAEISPNDIYVAYISGESGRPELYVRQLDGRGGKWQISSEGAVFPRWRADGKELYYYSYSSEEIVAVPVETDGAFEAGNPSVLFNSPLQVRIGYQIGPYDVSNDGQRFLINTRLSGSSTRKMIIVLNIDEQI